MRWLKARPEVTKQNANTATEIGPIVRWARARGHASIAMAMLLTTTLPTAIALSVLGVLALKAAWRARRSRRVGDHPHCAACDRDLFGLPAKTERCPECGADLRANSAVRKGAPRPNRLVQAAAVMVAVVLCGVATPNWRAVEWTPIGIHLAPTSWLIRQTNSSSATASLAANELDRRVQKDVYGEKQLEQVMRALYAVHGRGRPTSCSGQRWPFYCYFGPTGLGRSYAGASSSPPNYRVFHRLARIQVGNGPWVSTNQPWDGYVDSIDLPPELPSGPTTVRLLFAFRLIRSNPDAMSIDSKGPALGREPRPDEPATLAWEAQCELPVTILAKGATDVQLIVNPELRATMQASIEPAAIRLWDEREIRGVHMCVDKVNEAGDGYVDFGIAWTWLAADIAFDVFLRDANGVEVALGDLSASRRGSQSSIQASPAALAALKGWNSAQGEIILRPSVQAARKTTYLTKIWGEEIVLKNVPVVRDAPAADLSPTTQP